MKLLHVVDTLARNGRTILLQDLIRSMNSSVEHLVVTLMDTGPMTNRFSEMGIEVHALNVYSPFRGFRKKWKVISRIFHFQPNVCLCWSGVANISSTILRLFGIPVIWTLHNSTVRWNTFKTRYGVRLAALLSKIVPERIICCSNMTYDVYRDIHRFRENRLLVIANGVDVTRFRPNRNERERIRKEQGISDSALVVATAARIELPGSRYIQGDFKDLETLFKAAAITSQKKQDIYYLLFGSNINDENEQLVDWLRRYKLQENVKLLGFQNNVAALYAASDIYALSSTTGEGLPVSLIEAMACGAIPVCTDSGDIRAVVGPAGIVVPQKDAVKLATAILDIAELSESQRDKYSKNAVEIVKYFYNIELVARRYSDILVQVITGSTNGSSKHK